MQGRGRFLQSHGAGGSSSCPVPAFWPVRQAARFVSCDWLAVLAAESNPQHPTESECLQSIVEPFLYLIRNSETSINGKNTPNS